MSYRTTRRPVSPGRTRSQERESPMPGCSRAIGTPSPARCSTHSSSGPTGMLSSMMSACRTVALEQSRTDVPVPTGAQMSGEGTSQAGVLWDALEVLLGQRALGHRQLQRQPHELAVAFARVVRWQVREQVEALLEADDVGLRAQVLGQLGVQQPGSAHERGERLLRVPVLERL